jgi:hypothetical protein
MTLSDSQMDSLFDFKVFGVAVCFVAGGRLVVAFFGSVVACTVLGVVLLVLLFADLAAGVDGADSLSKKLAIISKKRAFDVKLRPNL